MIISILNYLHVNKYFIKHLFVSNSKFTFFNKLLQQNMLQFKGSISNINTRFSVLFCLLGSKIN